MTDSSIVSLKSPTEDALGEILKQGAIDLLAQAIRTEISGLLERYTHLIANSPPVTSVPSRLVGWI
jgi:hypothetical protein